MGAPGAPKRVKMAGAAQSVNPEPHGLRCTARAHCGLRRCTARATATELVPARLLH
jgi:hypothetical protein